MKVLNFGSLNIDYVYQVDHAVMPGETLATKSRNVFYGGKGFNQSIALSKAGVSVYHAGMIGNGGEGFLDLCKEYGVDTRYIKQIEGENGHTIIQVDATGQNCILLFGGSNQGMTKEYIDEVLENFTEGDLILLQNEINEMPYLIEQAYARKMIIVLNPSPYNRAMEACDLTKVSIFLLNEIEGEQITEQHEPEDIMKTMENRYPGAKVVLTLGEQGVMYLEDGQVLYEEARKVQAVDTTAAGDTFTGYFISGLIEDLPVEENLKRCVRAAAITVSREGAAESIPTKEQLS